MNMFKLEKRFNTLIDDINYSVEPDIIEETIIHNDEIKALYLKWIDVDESQVYKWINGDEPMPFAYKAITSTFIATIILSMSEGNKSLEDKVRKKVGNYVTDLFTKEPNLKIIK